MRTHASGSRMLVSMQMWRSGKTTLACALGAQLGLPVLEKDAMKEALSDAIGLPADVAASSRLGSAAYAACFSLARGLLADEVSVVLESNFRRGLSEAELVPVAAVASMVHLVHCTAPESVIMQRYRTRSRHAAHLDDHRYDAVRR